MTPEQLARLERLEQLLAITGVEAAGDAEINLLSNIQQTQTSLGTLMQVFQGHVGADHPGNGPPPPHSHEATVTLT